MKARKIGNDFIIRLEKGDKIIESLKKFCTENRIKLGYFTGLGAVSTATLAHYTVENKKYTEKTFSGPLEIIQLNGNITKMDGKPYLHAHIILSKKSMEAVAGHLVEGTVSATCEIVLRTLKGRVGRKRNEEIGLNLMDI